MLAGYVVLFLAVIILLPWGDDYPSVQIPSKDRQNLNEKKNSKDDLIS
jgi:hypothetical protein